MDIYIRRREYIILEYNNLKSKKFEPEKFIEAISKIHKTIKEGPEKYASEIVYFLQPQRENIM